MRLPSPFGVQTEYLIHFKKVVFALNNERTALNVSVVVVLWGVRLPSPFGVQYIE